MRVLDDWLLTSARAAVHLPTATAVIADVHLGYAEARHRGGEAVPGQSVASVLNPLRRVVDLHHVRRLVVAGDLFEAGAVLSMVTELFAWCAAAGVELLGVVPGNHDRGLAARATELSLYPEGVRLGDWCIVHGDRDLPDSAVVQGHEHPVARWNDRVGGPCYLVSGRRLILPAFSPDAAGVNVIRRKRWHAFRCCVISGEQVLDFGRLGELEARMTNRDRQGALPDGRGS